MVRNKSGVLENVAKAVVIGGLSLLPVVSNGQNIDRDKINWTRIQKNPYDKYTLQVHSQKPLLGLSQYQSSPPKEFLPGGNLNLYNYNYSVPQDEIKGETLNYIKYYGICPECAPCKTVKKPSTVKKTPYKKPLPKPVPKKPVTPSKLEEKTETPDIIYNITETNTTNNIDNSTNYYITNQEIKAAADSAKKKSEKDYLRFRTLIDAGKRVNPLNSPFWQSTINPQIGRGSVWGGPYATFGFGSENNETETPVYKKILLSQAAQIFTETEGTRKENTKSRYPVGFGGTLSLNTRDNKVRFDLSYGLANRVNSTSGISESGYDRKLVGDNVIEEKPYGPIFIEEGKKCSDWVPTQSVGIAFQPSEKVPIYLKGSAQHIGKISDKKEDVNFNIALGGNFGWGKKK